MCSNLRVLLNFTTMLTFINLYGMSTSFSPNFTKEIKTIRQVAIIKKQILERLGISDPPTNHRTHTARIFPLATVDNVTPSFYTRVDLRSYHSEAPENYTDESIIQFKLDSINGHKLMEVDSVNLLLRVQYKRKKTSKSKRETREMPLATESRAEHTKKEHATSSVKLTKRERKVQRRRNKMKRRGQQKQRLEISLIVSNVTADGKPGEVITTVKSTLKKTKSLKLTLPKDRIEETLMSSNHTIQFYIQCIGCGRKASLILVHKKRKRKRAHSKHIDMSRFLHKRRPILFVQSHVTSASNAS